MVEMESVKQANRDRSHGLCTWDEDADCQSCPVKYQLLCKWDKRSLSAFIILSMPFAVAGWFGMAMVAKFTGAWWYLVVNGAFYVLFFLTSEIRILCSHCPYYGGDTGLILKCLGNNGAIKLWKYHPEPMNSLERSSLVLGFIFFGGFPVLVNFYGVYFMAANYAEFSQEALLGMIGVAVLTLLASITFFAVLRIYVCSKCVNFSCPLNSVQKEVVDEYLRRNPVIRKAWEDTGYKLD